MTALWVVLWIIGVLLALVLLIFGLIVLLLVIPIRYKFNASDEGKAVYILRISYLFKAIRYTYEMRDGVTKSETYILFFKSRDRGTLLRLIRKWARRRLHRLQKEQAVNRPVPPKADESPPDELKELFAVLTDGEGKTIIKQAVVMLVELIKVIRPHYYDISGVVGLGCPFRTAMVMGMYESLAGIFGVRRKVRFAGDFNRTVFRYNAELRGKANALRIMAPIARFAEDEPLQAQEWLLILLNGEIKK